MKKPANLPGVLFALVMAVLLLVGVLVAGPERTSLRGVPAWLLAAIGVPCFLWLAGQCWLKPRRSRS